MRPRRSAQVGFASPLCAGPRCLERAAIREQLAHGVGQRLDVSGRDDAPAPNARTGFRDSADVVCDRRARPRRALAGAHRSGRAPARTEDCDRRRRARGPRLPGAGNPAASRRRRHGPARKGPIGSSGSPARRGARCRPPHRLDRGTEALVGPGSRRTRAPCGRRRGAPGAREPQGADDARRRRRARRGFAPRSLCRRRGRSDPQPAQRSSCRPSAGSRSCA